MGVEDVLGPFRSRIRAIARRYRVRSIRVFGSLARGAGKPDSDVDLLVEFDRSRTARSSLRSIDFALELETLLSRHVDVVTESGLHWYLQPQVIAEAVPL